MSLSEAYMQSMQVHCATHNEHCMDLRLGTLYSVDRGPGESGTQGPRTKGPGTQGPENPWTRIGVYCTCTYIVHVSLIARLDGMDYEILCIVDGTFVLAAFVPFHSVRHQKRPFIAGKV